MDKLSDRAFKTKIAKTFKSKKFDRKLVSELNEEFENRTAGLDENEYELWIKYDDILKAMINNINLNEQLDNDGDDDVDRNDSDADDDDGSDRSSQLDDDDRGSSSGSDTEPEFETELKELRRKLEELSMKKKPKRESRLKSDMKKDVPIHKIVKSINPFKDNLAEWPAFKRRVETMIIGRKDASEDLKRVLISGILKGRASSIWDRCEAKQMNLKKSWKILISSICTYSQ